MRHRNQFDSTGRGTIRSQQQIYSPSNHRQLLQYPNNNGNHRQDSGQYGSPTTSSSSLSNREQPLMAMNFSTSTPDSSPYATNGFNTTEQSSRFNSHSPIFNQQNSGFMTQFEPNNHVSQHLMMKQAMARPSASPPPPHPPPPPPPPSSMSGQSV